MWKHRSDILPPLTKMTSKQANWNWTKEHQKAFEKIFLLCSLPIIREPFVINKDARKVQLGLVIDQDNKPIAFNSRKLNPAQVIYTTTEKEILSIAANSQGAQKHSLRSANKSIY